MKPKARLVFFSVSLCLLLLTECKDYDPVNVAIEETEDPMDIPVNNLGRN